ncbi:conserved hypothetical protein [Verrucomicrobia bacterium]|nr:conserved hypothetical protein [Verrucomicrobiota bacterium]
MRYKVHQAPVGPLLEAGWDHPLWASAETLELARFRPESSDHRPRTRARLLYDERYLHGIFHVQDRFVRCLRTRYLEEVWKDSCVEFFAQPRHSRGYFNFEFNCGGALLCYYIVDPTRTPAGFKDFAKVPPELGQTILTRSSLPPVIDPEEPGPLEWTLQFSIPFAVFENYLGPLGELPGQVWRGNFYKCADESSHPHWAAWSPVDRLDFHRPDFFGIIEFA